MKAGIVIDDWKLSTFSRHLTNAGFAFVNKGTLTPGALLLEVDTEDKDTLTATVIAATTECATLGEPNQ